jgi:two-component system sensor histidine kinase YesM
MTLQQFVENAISHSFNAGYKEAGVEIQCVARGSGWRIRIADNGPGFSTEMLEKLSKEIPELQQKLLSQHTEFAIGGMGLLNTYARLWLFFGDNLVFAPGNNPEGGAYVIIEYTGEDKQR